MLCVDGATTRSNEVQTIKVVVTLVGRKTGTVSAENDDTGCLHANTFRLCGVSFSCFNFIWFCLWFGMVYMCYCRDANLVVITI